LGKPWFLTGAFFEVKATPLWRDNTGSNPVGDASLILGKPWFLTGAFFEVKATPLWRDNTGSNPVGDASSITQKLWLRSGLFFWGVLGRCCRKTLKSK